MNHSRKKYYQWEAMYKAAANHRRLELLMTLQDKPGLTVEQLSEYLDTAFVTVAPHLQKLARAGLIEKWYEGNYVHHRITKLGKSIISLCIML